MSRETVRIVIVACLVWGVPVLAESQAEAPRSPTPTPVKAAVRVETIARGLEHPWALAFLRDGRMLVTERPGRLRIVERDGRVSAPLPPRPPPRLSVLRGARSRWHGRDGGGAGPARRGPARGRPGDLPAAAEGAGREPFRVPPPLSPPTAPLPFPSRPGAR